jgi:tetratricopeptide (TPR) repeat protein
MKSLRKPLFWGLILLLVCLVCFATVLLTAYIAWQQTSITNITTAAPVIVNAQPTPNKTPGVEATISALEIEAGKYYDNYEYDKVLDLYEKMIALDPNNPEVYVESAYYFRRIANNKHSLDDFMDILNRGVATVNKGIEVDPKYGDLYAQRAFLFGTMANAYAYRVDGYTLNQLALDNLQASNSLGSKRMQHPERYWVNYLAFARQCDQAVTEANRLAAVEPPDDTYEPTIESVLELAYACKGDYKKALEYYLIDLRKTNSQDDACSCSSVYYYLLGKSDETLEKLNKSISDYPNYYGSRYFLRALIEYDRGEYDQALIDAQHADGNAWAFGMNSAYIQGLNAARLGQTEEAIRNLQYAEATFGGTYYFVAERAREELKKLKATPLVITPSVPITATPMPVYPTLDINTFPTHTPQPDSAYE